MSVPLVSFLIVLSAFSLCGTETVTEYELSYRKAFEEPMNLTSPNYPNQYPSNASYIWWIYTSMMYSEIHIRFLFLDIENSTNCENDNLTIYRNDRLSLLKVYDVCGNSTPRDRLRFSDDVIVILRSNNNTEGGGFVIQYYVEEHDDSHERDNYHSKGFSNNWGTVVIVVVVIASVVLLVAIGAACYCQRKQKQSEVQEMKFSRAAIDDGQLSDGPPRTVFSVSASADKDINKSVI